MVLIKKMISHLIKKMISQKNVFFFISAHKLLISALPARVEREDLSDRLPLHRSGKPFRVQCE